MFNLIFGVLSLMFSIGISAATTRRQKGEDWYSPITNNVKMLMSIINTVILLFIFTLFFEYLLNDIKLFATICIVLTVITVCVFIYNRMKTTNNSTQDRKKTVIELFAKFLTVFNSFYFLQSTIQICILASRIGKTNMFSSAEMVFALAFNDNNILIVSFTLLLWTSIIGTVTSFYGWTYKDSVDTINTSSKIDHVYYSKRVSNRNRKS